MVLWIRRGGTLKVGAATVVVLQIENGGVKLGFKAPPTVSILRDNAKKRVPTVKAEPDSQNEVRADHTRTINGIYDPTPKDWGRRPKKL